jgi:O-acetylserine/cysteine efflux transporter
MMAFRGGSTAMKSRDMALACLTSVIWGFAFVIYKFSLADFTPAQITALRFLIAALPVLVVPRPRVSWSLIVLIGLTLFTGQFLLLFVAFALGMPAGLASVTQQMQAFFTVLLAALFLGDRPSLRQLAGMAVAFAGLALVGGTTGADLKLSVLALALAAAFSWAIGNVLVKRAADTPVFPLMVWCSLIPPLPALLFSALMDHGPSFAHALGNASWGGLATAIYLGTLASPIAYGMWGYLLQRYSTAMVAPFALLSPCIGVLGSVLILGETFSALRMSGMALILVGLVVILVPVKGLPRAAGTA